MRDIKQDVGPLSSELTLKNEGGGASGGPCGVGSSPLHGDCGVGGGSELMQRCQSASESGQWVRRWGTGHAAPRARTRFVECRMHIWRRRWNQRRRSATRSWCQSCSIGPSAHSPRLLKTSIWPCGGGNDTATGERLEPEGVPFIVGRRAASASAGDWNGYSERQISSATEYKPIFFDGVSCVNGAEVEQRATSKAPGAPVNA